MADREALAEIDRLIEGAAAEFSLLRPRCRPARAVTCGLLTLNGID
jgi:hypothetical protein